VSVASGDEPVDLGRMACVIATDKAVLVEGKLRDGKVGQVWVPKSVLHQKCRIKKKGDAGALVVKTWWFEKNQDNL